MTDTIMELTFLTPLQSSTDAKQRLDSSRFNLAVQQDDHSFILFNTLNNSVGVLEDTELHNLQHAHHQIPADDHADLKEMGFIADPRIEDHQVYAQYIEKYAPDQLHLSIEAAQLRLMLTSGQLPALTALLQTSRASSITLIDFQGELDPPALHAYTDALATVHVPDHRLQLSARHLAPRLTDTPGQFTSVCLSDLAAGNIDQALAFARAALTPDGTLFIALSPTQDHATVDALLRHLNRSWTVQITEAYGPSSHQTLAQRTTIRAQLSAHGYAVSNTLNGPVARPFACPASHPSVFLISADLTLYKCPASPPHESRVGAISGARAHLDQAAHRAWTDANGHLAQQRPCTTCPVLPKCFGEVCPKALIHQRQLICPTEQAAEAAELTWIDLESSPADEHPAPGWFPPCSGGPT